MGRFIGLFLADKLGVETIPITVEQTLKAHEAVDIKAAEAEAKDYWISRPKKILEQAKDEIINSARFYLVTKNLGILMGFDVTEEA